MAAPEVNATGCRSHRAQTHSFFISYRVDRSPTDRVDSALAGALHAAIEAAGERFFPPGSLRAYLDRLCINEGALWEKEFLNGLRGSDAVILLLSRRSWDIAVENLRRGVADNVLKEIQMAIELKKKIIPLAVKGENDSNYFDLQQQDLTQLTGPIFDGLKQAAEFLKSIKMLQIDSKKPQIAVYRILNVLFPVQPSDQPLAMVPIPHRAFHSDMTLLSQIAMSLATAGHCIISGVGGMGKSTVVQQFIHYSMGKWRVPEPDLFPFSGNEIMYERAYWINCATPETAMDSLRTLLHTTGHDETVNALRALLSAKSRILVVFDNVDDPAVTEALFAELEIDAAAIAGDFCVTTRLDEIPEGDFLAALMDRHDGKAQQLVNVGRWPIDVARDYVLVRCPSLKTAAAAGVAVALDAFLERVGGYPIVIEQFVAFYNHKKPPVSALEGYFKNVLVEGEASRHSTLVGLVKLSLQGFEKTDSGKIAVMLYGCTGLLDGSKLQFKLLSACVDKIRDDLDMKEEDVDALDVINLLRQCGILRHESADGVYSMHSLHQTIVRDLGAKVTTVDLSDVYKTTCHSIMTLLDSEGYFSTEQARLATHVPILSNFGSTGKWVIQDYWIKSMEAQMDHYFGRLQSAFDRQLLILSKAEEVFGTRDKDTVAVTLTSLGKIASDMGRSEDELKYFKECLDIVVRILGTEHMFTSAALGNMAGASARHGLHKEATEYAKKALEIAIKIRGRRDAQVAGILHSMGINAHALEEYDESLKYFKEALDIRVSLLGSKDHVEVSRILKNIAGVLEDQKNYTESLKYYQDTLDVQVAVYNTREHPQVLDVLTSMGDVAAKLGHHDDALGFYSECVDTAAKLHAPAANTAKLLNKAGRAAAAMDRLADAAELHERALALFEEAADAVNAAQTANLLGVVARRRTLFDEAARRHRDAVDGYVRAYGTRLHAAVARSLINSGVVEFDRMRFDEALRLFEEARDVAKEASAREETVRETEEWIVKAKAGAVGAS